MEKLGDIVSGPIINSNPNIWTPEDSARLAGEGDLQIKDDV